MSKCGGLRSDASAFKCIITFRPFRKAWSTFTFKENLRLKQSGSVAGVGWNRVINVCQRDGRFQCFARDKFSSGFQF